MICFVLSVYPLINNSIWFSCLPYGEGLSLPSSGCNYPWLESVRIASWVLQWHCIELQQLLLWCEVGGKHIWLWFSFTGFKFELHHKESLVITLKGLISFDIIIFPDANRLEIILSRWSSLHFFTLQCQWYPSIANSTVCAEVLLQHVVGRKH